MSPLQRLRRRLTANDGGFTLIETVVALVVFALLMVSVTAVLLNALGTSRTNRQRVEAASLASRQLDIARGQAQAAKLAGTGCPACAIPDGLTGPYRQTVGGTTYTIAQTAEFVTDNSPGSTCDSTLSSRIGYKRVTESVTWPDMRGVKPVRSDSLVEVGVAGLDPTKGAIAVSVKDRDDVGEPGQLVTLTPGNLTQVTGDDGCVVFTNLDPSVPTYTATLSTTGYVDYLSHTPSSVVTSATASQVSHVAFTWDRSATLLDTYVEPPPPNGASAWTVPDMPLTLVNSAFAGGTRTYGSCSTTSDPCASTDTPRAVDKLFPSYDGYTAYAGACNESRPGTLPAAAVPVPGGTVSTTTPVGGVIIHDTLPQGYPSFPIYALHYGSDPGCPEGAPTSNDPNHPSPGEIINLGTLAPGQTLASLIPFGNWVLSITPDESYYYFSIPTISQANPVLEFSAP